MAPREPVDIPDEAFTALQGLRDAIVDIIPQQLDFAIGIKQVNGEYQDDLALIVLIPDKLPRDQVPPEQLIPSDFGGFVTDVVQFQPEEITDSSVHDPLVGGIQISRPAMTAPDGVSLIVHAGTLGAIARNRSDGALLMLTNRHVLPDAGVDVHQPSDLTAGHRVVGTSDRAVATSNWLDCAVATVAGGQATSAQIADLGPVAGTSTISLWQQVTKRGARTDVTSGLVVSVVPDLSQSPAPIIGMIIDTFPFGGVFCWNGDSGSVILNSKNEVVGLLYAMNDNQVDASGTPVSARGLASTIDPVLDALFIDIVVGP
jgi:Trypsin-like peptidase domain